MTTTIIDTFDDRGTLITISSHDDGRVFFSAELDGHVYDGYVLRCPNQHFARYAGHHQFTCPHGVWNVGGVAGSREAQYAIGYGDGRHIPTIHAHITPDRLAVLGEVRRLRTTVTYPWQRARYGARACPYLSEASDAAVAYMREHHRGEYERLLAMEA